MGRRIMAIDPDEAILALYQDVLAEEGYEVALCDGSGATYDRVRDVMPDVIILDSHLDAPLNGWQMLALLAEDAHLRDIPIVMSTTEMGPARDHVALLARPGVVLLEKPFDLDDLLRQLHRLLAGEMVRQ